MSTPTSASPSDLLTYEDAAALLGISVGAVKRAVSMGKLHPRRFPGTNRKYLDRTDVLTYPDRRNAPLSDAAPIKRHRGVGASTDASASQGLPDAAQLRELAGALSGPTLEAFREAMSTARHGVGSLAQIAFGVALGTSGMASMAGGAALDPKR